MLKSKTFICVLLILVVAVICFTYRLRTEWWCFIDVFFFFMAAFLQLMSLFIARTIPSAGRTLSRMAFFSAILAIIALIAETIVWLSIW